MKTETQETISQWSADTFGAVVSNARVAARANEEMAELLRTLTTDGDDPAAGAEIADVVIVLYRLASLMGFELDKLVNSKMAINRQRKWSRDGSGHGYDQAGRAGQGADGARRGSGRGARGDPAPQHRHHRRNRLWPNPGEFRVAPS